MSDALPAVRKHIETFERWAKTAQDRDDESGHQVWSGMAAVFATLADDYERLKDATRPVPASYGDLSDLPPSLRAQLAFGKTDELDDQITIIVKAADNGADLDTILIELWRRFKVEQTRRFIQNKAYRLAQKGVIHSVAGRKGLYAATPEDAKRLAPTANAAATPTPAASGDNLASEFDDFDMDDFSQAPSDGE